MAKEQLNSDIVTIFLYAPKKRQLWSRWGTNLPNDITTGKTRPIRVPANVRRPGVRGDAPPRGVGGSPRNSACV